MLTGFEKIQKLNEGRSYAAKEVRRRRNCFIGLDISDEIRTMIREDLKVLISRSSSMKPTFKNLLKRARNSYDYLLSAEWGSMMTSQDTEYYSACGHADAIAEGRHEIWEDFVECVRAAKYLKEEERLERLCEEERQQFGPDPEAMVEGGGIKFQQFEKMGWNMGASEGC